MTVFQRLGAPGRWSVLVVAATFGALTDPSGLSAQHSESPGAGPDSAVLRSALEAFWAAESESSRSAALDGLFQLRPPVDAVTQQLRIGPAYQEDVPRGLIESSWTSDDGTSFPYLVHIPDGYDPSLRYPVRVYLHGGVSRGAWGPGERWWRTVERVISSEVISVFPAAWTSHRWWQRSQVESVREILRRLERTYNVDENRVAMVGVSDGGTGAYFFAFKDTTPWASFLPFIAHPAVLLNPSVGAEGSMYLHNLTNKPFFVVNGTDDRLYPTRVVEPFVAEFLEAGVDVTYRPQEGGGHDTRWWPAEADRIDAFVDRNPRDPHPSRISWEVEVDSPFTRAHWITIDELGPGVGDARFSPSVLLDSGAFAGRVDASREGNTFEVSSANVRRLTLLLSDDVIDFANPVRVVWNGQVAYDGRVDKNLSVLLDWAARDHDRTMLYQAALTVDWRAR